MLEFSKVIDLSLRVLKSLGQIAVTNDVSIISAVLNRSDVMR